MKDQYSINEILNAVDDLQNLKREKKIEYFTIKKTAIKKSEKRESKSKNPQTKNKKQKKTKKNKTLFSSSSKKFSLSLFFVLRGPLRNN